MKARRVFVNGLDCTGDKEEEFPAPAGRLALSIPPEPREALAIRSVVMGLGAAVFFRDTYRDQISLFFLQTGRVLHLRDPCQHVSLLPLAGPCLNTCSSVAWAIPFRAKDRSYTQAGLNHQKLV